ncbi:MAG TPA: alginate lyase family protein [Natronosporangium sp.]
MAGFRLRRRWLAAAGAAVLAALLAWPLGAGWAGTAVAALAGATAVTAGVATVELRRLRARTAATERRLGELQARIEVVSRTAAAQAQAAWEYPELDVAGEPDSFVLYRIIGNDLPPRHHVRQTLANLRFILAHEPRLPNCQKRWVLNRIVSPQVEQQVIDLLTEYEMPYLRIPFDMDEYRRIGWRFDGFPVPGFTYRPEFLTYSPLQREWALDHVYHDKNLYVMNNNGARNAALEQGRTLAKWVLPWDGNCFVTEQAWAQIVAAVTARPYLKYFTVPMARVVDNEVLLRPDPELDCSEEPQLLFRRDAKERFDPNARYGRCPKVELFWRLGITGKWDNWCRGPWDPPRAGLSIEAGQVGEAGWVARLSSGEPAAERDYRDRAARRSQAIRARIDQIDGQIAAATFRPSDPFTLDLDALEQQRQSPEPGPRRVVSELLETAERSRDPVVAALAGVVTRERQWFERGAAALRERYRGSPRGGRQPALPFLLDAAMLFAKPPSVLDYDDMKQWCAWLRARRAWLQESAEGAARRAALDHRGTWYDVELAAIAAYFADLPGLLAVLRRAHERVRQQFGVDGVPAPVEVGNLLGWVLLARWAERAGQDLWSPLGKPLAAATGDPEQRAVLAHLAAGAVPGLLAALDPAHRDPYQLRQVFDDPVGIRPFWSLGLRPAPGAAPAAG